MLHLAVVNSTTTLHILQNMVLNLGLPWALAGQQEDVMGKEWHPSLKIQAVQSDIIETLEKVSITASAQRTCINCLPSECIFCTQDC